MPSLASLKMEGGAGADHAQQTSYQNSFNIQKRVQKKKKRIGKEEKGQKRIRREFSVQSPNYCPLTVRLQFRKSMWMR